MHPATYSNRNEGTDELLVMEARLREIMKLSPNSFNQTDFEIPAKESESNTRSKNVSFTDPVGSYTETDHTETRHSDFAYLPNEGLEDGDEDDVSHPGNEVVIRICNHITNIKRQGTLKLEKARLPEATVRDVKAYQAYKKKEDIKILDLLHKVYGIHNLPPVLISNNNCHLQKSLST